MLNNLSQGFSLGFAGDEDETSLAPATPAAVEFLAGLTTGVDTV
jgi:hypothetical protein